MTDQPTQMRSAYADQPEALTVWLVSPYHTGSHQAWAEGYQRYSHHQVHLLPLTGRFWKWRMQGGALELAVQAQKQLAQTPPALPLPDVVLATDMLHLPVWVGLLRGTLPGPVLERLALVCYMHENQLTYPWRPGEKPDLTYAMINWLSQVAADRVLFNSQYHLESWFSALPSLLKHYPDYNNLGLVDKVRARSAVAPVGIDVATEGANIAGAERMTPGPATESIATLQDKASAAPLIVWNHRWEYDKRPDRFFALLYRLQAAAIPFRLAVAGENFRNVPEEFEAARHKLADRIVHWGYLPNRASYVALLQQADLIISTADHEFFGVSVLEAIAAGAFPLLPSRLSYPELLPAALHPACLYGDEEELWHKAAAFLTQARTPTGRRAAQATRTTLRQHVAATYGWPAAAQHTDQWLARVVAHKVDSAQRARDKRKSHPPKWSK